MKNKLFIFIFIALGIGVSFAQIPQTLSFQGLLSEKSGQRPADGKYSLTFRLYDQESGGQTVWTEEQSDSVVSGLINVNLGEVNPLNLPFDKPYWLGISVNGGEEFTPRTPLTSSAYSMAARTVADSAITAAKVAKSQLVRSINSIKDDVVLEAGDNVSIDREGNKLRISAIANSDSVGNSLNEAYNAGGPGAGRVITANAGAFEIGGSDGVVFKGKLDQGSIPAEGEGPLMMWYPGKAAFRAGYAYSDFWNDAKIGKYSFSTGYGTMASGNYSTALGRDTYASGYYSIAMGRQAYAASEYSIAIGNYVRANSSKSIALGSGYDLSFPLKNEKENSLVVSFKTDSATFFIGPADANHTTGKVGIGTSNPQKELDVNGDAHVRGKITSGSANVSLPIAYGSIAAIGTIRNATNNITKVERLGNTYLITIQNEEYNNSDYVTMVTATSSHGYVRMVTTDAYQNKLQVIIGYQSGSQITNDFHFVVYKL